MSSAHIEKDSIYFLGAGAQTPVGRSVLSAAAAVRCRLAAHGEHPSFTDTRGSPIVVARAKWLGDDLSVEDRSVSLAIGAATEALRVLIRRGVPGEPTMSVHLALSAETLPDDARRCAVIDRIAARIGLTGADSAIHSVVRGHAGGLLALENAVGDLRGGKAQLCLIGGVDTFLDLERLRALEIAGRLHSRRQNRGFIPGEGAGFCLLATGSVARKLGIVPLAKLEAVATAHEAKILGSRTVCIGEGLTTAFRGVLPSGTRVSHTYCDLNGEPYRADEYAFAVCRTAEHFENAGRFTAAAECWGDVGAASATLALALPIAAWARGYGKGEPNLVWSSSAHGSLRGAALVQRWAGVGEPCS